MQIALTRTALLYIALVLALAGGAVLYLATHACGGSLNALGAVVAAGSALILSNKLWK